MFLSSISRALLGGSRTLNKTCISSSIPNVIQIRTSTKKAGGGRVNNKDSIGRRLGSKKGEGSLVSTGEIIFRQRGTKLYPGENCGIGRDHTIFALEPGYVRYYFDPFHPKRKFVGVALTKDLRLPSDHWSPRDRRFGYVEIEDPIEAQKEEEHLPKKKWLLKESLTKDIEARETKRQEKKKIIAEQLSKISSTIPQTPEIIDRLLLIQRFLNNGFSISEAQENATFNDLYDLKLKLKKNEITSEEFSKQSEEYNNSSSTLNEEVGFNYKLDLIKKLSIEELQALKIELFKKLSNSDAIKDRKQIETLINEAAEIGALSKSELVHIKRKYLKNVAPESIKSTISDKKDKKGSTYNRFDYEQNKVVTINRTKNAFANKN